LARRLAAATAAHEEDDDENEDHGNNPIPELTPGQQLTVDGGELVEMKTKAPKRYTEASLVGRLKAEGIGRPSTYAAIMSLIVSRGYVALKGKKNPPLEATPIGEAVYDALAGKFQFIDLGYTRELEKSFDAIASGKATYLPVITAAHQQLLKETGQALANVETHACPKCGKPMRRRAGKKAGEHWWGCSGYPDCKTTCPDVAGKPGAPKAPAAPPSEHKCKAAKCGKPLRRIQGSNERGPYDFYACTGKPKCKQTYRTGDDGNPVYPAT